MYGKVVIVQKKKKSTQQYLAELKPIYVVILVKPDKNVSFYYTAYQDVKCKASFWVIVYTKCALYPYKNLHILSE